MKILKRQWDKLRAINHLFAKAMVLWCVICGTVASAYALRILSRTGHDPAALLGVILAFFGGELLLMCLKTVLSEKDKSKTQNLSTKMSDFVNGKDNTYDQD